MAAKSASHEAVLSLPHTCPGTALGLTKLDSQIPAIFTETIPENTLVKQGVRLEITNHIGLPLNCYVLIFGADDQLHVPAPIARDLSEAPENPILRILSLCQSSSNGEIQHCLTYGVPRPVILLFRADGEQLLPVHVSLMWLFAQEAYDKNRKDNLLNYKQFLLDITPTKFVEFWEKDPRLQGLQVKCPVRPGVHPGKLKFHSTPLPTSMMMTAAESQVTGAVMCTSQEQAIPMHGYNLPALFASSIPEMKGPEGGVLLLLTVRIGLPLYFLETIPDPDDPDVAEWAQHELQLGLVDTRDNPVLRLFSIRKVVNSPWVAETQLEGHANPNIVLVRADGKLLAVEHVVAMWIFIQEALDGMKAELQSMFADSRPLDYATFAAKMTPKKFVEFWEKQKELGRLHGECPVKLGCKTCGKMGKLMRCAKCGLVEYCGRECQKDDWASHKAICKDCTKQWYAAPM